MHSTSYKDFLTNYLVSRKACQQNVFSEVEYINLDETMFGK